MLGWPGVLQSMEDPLAEQRKVRLPIALSFDQFEPGHVPFHHAVVDPPGEASSHRVFVFLDPSRKGLKFGKVTAFHLVKPAIKVLSGAAVSPRPSAVTGASTSAQSPPAHYFQNLPAGTLVAVRLKKPVYASTSASESSFEALVVEPVVVGAHTLIPKGAMVAGRVEAARTSNIKPNRGYVRLTLDSVEVGEHRVPLQTASLFAREAPMGDDPISVIHLEKGRRLTFRVAETPIASNQYAQGTH